MLCVVSLKHIMQIYEQVGSLDSKICIEHFLSIPKSVAGVTTVLCVIS